MSTEYAPAWTMTGRKNENNDNDIPGPGSYSPRPQLNSSQFKIGMLDSQNFKKRSKRFEKRHGIYENSRNANKA